VPASFSVQSVRSLAQQLRDRIGAAPRRPRYRAAEVLTYLRGDEAGANAAEIAREVQRLPTILRESGVRRRFDGYQRYFDVLPRIIFLYHRRVPVAQIAEDLSILATEVGVEAVIVIVANLVAERLNRSL
jgi:hypothetical protein